jgi:alpha-N-arabinofuranosidase
MHRITPLALLCLVALTSASSAQPQEPVLVSIDTASGGKPISKYIYGQFIEHLGRCIYGGIWAEMLEDRKFYYPIKGSNNPWKIVTPGETSWEGEGIPYELLTSSPWLVLGKSEQIRMVTDNSFVGDHTPELVLNGQMDVGIYQERLGLVKGQSYSGRVVLTGTDTTSSVLVSLIWGQHPEERDTVEIDALSEDYTTFPLAFAAGASTDSGRLEVRASGGGSVRIGTVSLMPTDNIRGFRRDTLRLMKELNSPVYRWPGGNFVSGYDWKDGIGNRDQRPPRKNPAWKGIEANDVGIHEFIDLCRELDTEPFITVNTGLGDVESARQEVEYSNGSASTPMGKLRAANGHSEPFRVKWWAVGNEMYGDWQLGHMPLKEYVKKHNRVAEAMLSVDPDLQLVAVGSVGPWTSEMLRSSSDHMHLISEHFYVQDKEDLVAHIKQVPSEIRRIADAHRQYRREIQSLQKKVIPVALDEYNYWYGGYVYGELGTRYFLQDALGVAMGIHEFIRNGDVIFMANYAQTVNVIGAIKTSSTAAEFAATGLALKLYRTYFGSIPVETVTTQGPLDVLAAWTEDKQVLTLGVVNPTEAALTLRLSYRGATFSNEGTVRVLTGPGRMAYNEPGKPRSVTIEKKGVADTSKLRVAPLSASVFELRRKNGR